MPRRLSGLALAALAAALALPAAGPARAQQETPPAADEAPPWSGALRQGVSRAVPAGGRPELVIYVDGRALVREDLRLELRAGTDTALWSRAPGSLDPASLSLRFPDGRAEVLETVHRPAAAGPDAALAGLVGREIAVRVVDGGELLRGRLVSARDGALALRTGGEAPEDGDGGVVVVPTGRIASYRLPGLPPGFRTDPAVVWTVRAEWAGERRGEVAYLAGGIGWDAEYVARLSPGEDRMSLEGRAVVRNGTDRAWEGARVKLVAGQVGREDGGRDRAMAARALAEDAAATAEQRAVGDFHVYELPRPLTLEDGTTVRSRLLRAPEVPVEKIYRVEGGAGRWPPPRPQTSPGYGPDREEEHAAVVLALANREDAGLGRPLPAGRVRIYRRDEDGGLLLAGADRIADTPAGDSVHLEIARAFDVVRERTVTDFRQPSRYAMEEDVRLELRNAKEEPVTVQAVERLARWTEWEVVDPRVDGEPAEPERLDAGRVLWRVRVPGGGSAAVTYTARYRWSPQDER